MRLEINDVIKIGCSQDVGRIIHPGNSQWQRTISALKPHYISSDASQMVAMAVGLNNGIREILGGRFLVWREAGGQWEEMPADDALLLTFYAFRRAVPLTGNQMVCANVQALYCHVRGLDNALPPFLLDFLRLQPGEELMNPFDEDVVDEDGAVDDEGEFDEDDLFDT
mmetsp:Transcript_10495/g.17688  ORF Transcript_10495/g.17688 Transcript_10495/m.17688 type:complete len:168 (-) Transcript_10495:123-626(-)